MTDKIYSTHTRNKDFTQKCRTTLKTMPSRQNIPFNRLVDMIIHSEAPGYYVSYEYALRRINEIHKTGKSSVRNNINRLLWNEIYRKTIDALHSRRFRNIPHALTHVLVTEKASRFFISHQQAMRLFSSNRSTLKNSKQ